MSDEKMLAISNEIENTRDSVQNSIGLIIDRGEKIDVLVEKSELLNENSRMFKTQAKRLKHKMCIKKLKMTALLIIIILFIMFIIAISICGFDFCLKN